MIEQEKYKSVIKGFECCLPMTAREGIGDCKNCPYDRKITFEGGVCECCHDLMSDALTLLQAQHDDIKALRQLVEWAEECGFGLDNIPWYEYATEEELDKVHSYIETMIYVARKAVNENDH